jgi:putative secretion ATPase (PEP-CTERM system associated)
MFDDFYGLKGRPFQLTPDPSFYFESLTHRKALSYLGYGLAQGEGFVVITGEVGSGKSTLVAHLMATIDPSRLTAAQVVTSKLDGEEIVHVVAQAFGLLIEGHDKATALGEIENFLHEEARAGRRCLLIVDESQNLAISALEELRMLSNFQLGAHPLLQTLLLGQPEFRDMLAAHQSLEQLRQRVIASHHLEPMQPQEIQQYIEHRMKCVGWEGNPAFDQRVFSEIYAASGGIPRRVNQIVNRLLLLGAVDQRTRIDGAMVQQVLSELAEDGSLTIVRPEVKPEPAAAPAPEPAAPHAADETESAPQAFAAAPVEPQSLDLSAFEAVLAERDAQIAELQRAVVELSDLAPVMRGPDKDSAELFDALNERLTSLETHMLEQDRTIRHTLTMLIEWVEEGDSRRDAA